ncbi:MAG TPA: hypothetical protein DCM87_06370 [Planctomycetes bacterium]|nr:hypothetical protein [Planctomycetota bacterium]
MASLCVLLVVCGAADGGRYGDFGPVRVRVACAEVTNVYLESDFPGLFREPMMTLVLENTSAERARIACRAEVVDFRGNRRAVRPAETAVDAAPGEKTRVAFTTDPARGVFTLRVTLRGEGALAALGEKQFMGEFSVAPPVSPQVVSDAFFRIEGDRLWRPYTAEVCRRLGAKVAMVPVASQTSQELFDGWATAARQRGLSLVPVCDTDALFGAAQTVMASRGAEKATAGTRVAWNRCAFVLPPDEQRTAVLAHAARQTLQGYTLCGEVTQLAYLLARAEQADKAKLLELGFVLGAGDGPTPPPDPYFLRMLDRCAEVARTHGTRVSLHGFAPSRACGGEAASLVAAYTQASLAGFHAVNARGPGGIMESPGSGGFVLGHVHAVLAHFLRGKVPVVDLWPHHTLLTGCVFARPDARPKDEVRSAVLAARDAAEQGPQDDLKVAVIFSRAARLADAGEIAIQKGGDCAAYDLSGNAVGVRRDDALVLPFGEEPVFVTTRSLGAAEFAGKLRHAQVRGLDLFYCAVMPLARPALELPDVRLFLDNSDTRALDGLVKVQSEGWQAASEGGTRFTLKAGEAAELKVAMKKIARRNDGIHPFRVSVETRFGVREWQLMVPSALVWSASASVDGKLDEWERMAGLPFPPPRAGGEPSGGEPSAQGMLWAAQDRGALYLACRISGVNAATAWNGDASPAGLRAACAGFAIQAAIGAGTRSADCPRKPGDPWYWKGLIRDTEHLFLIAPQADGGASVLCLHDPSMVWGETFLRGAAPVEGAHAVAVRTRDGVIVEARIPRRAVPSFGAGTDTARIGMVVHAGDRTLQLGEAYGVPPYLASGGSFLPASRADLLPNMISWGIVR